MSRGGSNSILLQYYCKVLQYFGVVTSQSIAISIEKSQSIAISIAKCSSIVKSIAKYKSIAKSIEKFKSIPNFRLAEQKSAVVFFTEF